MISTTKNKAEEGRWIELGKGSQLHRMFRVGRWVAITFAIGTKTYGRNQNECGYCGYLKLCAMVEKNASEYFFMHLALSSFPRSHLLWIISGTSIMILVKLFYSFGSQI